MIAPGNSFVQLVLALAFVVASGYASGRIHQWYKHGLERDHAFREGYDQASQSMFDMAISTGRRTPVTEAARPTPSVGPVNGRRPSRFETANLDSVAATVGQVPAPSPSVGASRRRITPHPASPHPATPSAGKRRRHAA
jgi:hypothetical protein